MTQTSLRMWLSSYRGGSVRVLVGGWSGLLQKCGVACAITGSIRMVLGDAETFGYGYDTLIDLYRVILNGIPLVYW